MLRLDRPLSASFGLVLATYAHAVGWPMVRGGAARRRRRRSSPSCEAAGGEIVTGPSGRLARRPAAGAGRRCSTSRHASSWRSPATGCRARTRRRAERFRYGPGVFKVDWALDGPVPWAAEGPRRAATVHLGGTLEEIAASEADVAAGRHPGAAVRPVRPVRAVGPVAGAGRQDHRLGVLPRAVGLDRRHDRPDRGAGRALRARLPRPDPGPRDARARPAMEAHDANYVGGDINGGIQDIRQLVFRPWPSLDPYRVGAGLYLCSSSTPPGGGVHGMGGLLAARSALRHELR